MSKKCLFDAAVLPFYDSWEIMNPEDQAIAQRKKLVEYINFARSSVPFYKERLAGFNESDEEPLAAILPLTSSDLRPLLPPVSTKLLSLTTEYYTVFQSGGTTGFPKSTLFSFDELEMLNLPNSRGFFAIGLTKEDRVANLFAVGGLYMTFIHINRMLQQYGCKNFPFSNHTATDFIHTVTKLFGINCFTGIASVILNTMRGMIHLGIDGLNIEKVFFAGEHLYEADQNELKEKFGVKCIKSPGYGTVETWYIGYQCDHCPLGVFHAHNDQCYIEIVNPDDGKHSGKGVPGLLYVTPFPRRLTPVIRYSVGDRAKWLSDSCSCGRTTPLFKLMGRGDNILRIGFDSVDYEYIQQILSEYKGLSSNVQIEKKRVDGRDLLVVRVETTEGEASSNWMGQMQHELEAKITEGRPSLREAVAKESVWPISVEILKPGALPRNSRTGKLIRVVDAIKG